MIVTDFQNVEKYYGISEAIKICVEYAKNNDLLSFECGSYEICDGIKVNIDDCTCSKEPKFEGHRKMVDIQLNLNGTELCYVAEIKKAKVEIPYNEEKDVEWFSIDTANSNKINMDQSTIVILFPEDIHSPTIYSGYNKVKKAIFKINFKKFFC